MTSSVLNKSIFDTKLQLIKLFLCFNKNHLQSNIGGFLGLTLTTDFSRPFPRAYRSILLTHLQYCDNHDVLSASLWDLAMYAVAIIPLTVPPRPNTTENTVDDPQQYNTNQIKQLLVSNL
jgi:hypothetical protein